MYQVDWTKRATEYLASLWTAGDAVLRRRITLISNDLDYELSMNPKMRGESRGGKNRILFRSPLTIYFHVDDAKKLVTVLKIILPRRRK